MLSLEYVRFPLGKLSQLSFCACSAQPGIREISIREAFPAFILRMLSLEYIEIPSGKQFHSPTAHAQHGIRDIPSFPSAHALPVIDRIPSAPLYIRACLVQYMKYIDFHQGNSPTLHLLMLSQETVPLHLCA